MNLNASFIRKIVYISAIVALLFPLFILGQPSAGGQGGGKLAHLRRDHNLSQANLGEIDPASESIKLATLGMRGVAANILWGQANHYKKTEDFDNFRAALNQITKLQPNFLSVWEFQAHNLSFNISTEFDDYRYRYHWVKKGIDFLIEGTRYNRREAQLQHSVGWYIGHKIGRSDERKYFRRLFRQDRDFLDSMRDYVDVDDADDYRGRPDNWLMARLWYAKAEGTIDRGGKIKGRNSPLLFYYHRPRSLTHSAISAEDEGLFDDFTKQAFIDATEDWNRFGSLEIPTNYGHTIVLNDLPKLRREVTQLRKQLVDLAPGLEEEIRKKKIANLPSDMRQAFELPAAVRSENQANLAMQAEFETQVFNEDLAEQMPEEHRAKARNLALLAAAKNIMASRVHESEATVNFDYWRRRCEFEQTDLAIEARTLVDKANGLFFATKPAQAVKNYETAWDKWAEIFKLYPVLEKDVTAEELMDSIALYLKALEQLDIPPPQDFKLKRLLQLYELNPNRLPEDAPGNPYPRYSSGARSTGSGTPPTKSPSPKPALPGPSR